MGKKLAIPSYNQNKRPWDRLEGETPKAYHAFQCYFHLPLGKRTVLRAYKDHVLDNGDKSSADLKAMKRAPSSWKQWSADNNWVHRAELHDDHVEQMANKRWRQQLVKERDRQYQLAVVIQSKVMQRLNSMSLDEIPASAMAGLLRVAGDMAYTALGHEKKQQTVEVDVKQTTPLVIEHMVSRRDPNKSEGEVEEASFEIVDSRDQEPERLTEGAE